MGKLRCLVRRFTKTIASLFVFFIAASASLHAQETTPLGIWAAAAKGDLDRLNMLLAEDDEAANAGDESGNSPLHHAAWNSQLAAMQLLLDHDADINLQSDQLWTPLHWATRNGRAQSVGWLLNHGAKVDVPAHLGQTALHTAILIAENRQPGGVPARAREGFAVARRGKRGRKRHRPPQMAPSRPLQSPEDRIEQQPRRDHCRRRVSG